MVTNQMMIVKINGFGNLEIGHKDMMGKVSQVVEMGNQARIHKGANPFTLDQILKKQEFWEFVIARNTQIVRKSKSSESEYLKNSGKIDTVYSDFSKLSGFITDKSEIQYSELMKGFPNLIYSKRGKNGGTWAELYILLKIASMLDKDFEVEIYRIFIEDQLLYFRDLGGDNFKELNILIDSIPDRIGKNNEYYYITTAIKIREKLDIISTRGYNQQEHDAIVQQKRTEYLSNLSSMIRVGLIKTASQLLEIIEKL